MKDRFAFYTARLRRQKRWRRIVGVAALLVALCTVYMMMLPAVTMGARTFCGKEEHTHSEECWFWQGGGAATPSGAGVGTSSDGARKRHTAGDRSGFRSTGRSTPGNGDREKNYGMVQICGKEEHVHSLICYSDPEADLETEEIWRQTIPPLTGDPGADMVRVAESQMNYRESARNYQVIETEQIKGCSRYGQWYGDIYGDWGTMFVSFCMNYAGVEDAPIAEDYGDLVQAVKTGSLGRYREKDYVPAPGDLVFLESGRGEPGRVGIIREVIMDDQGSPARLVTIEGDVDDQVDSRTYQAGSEEIAGYGAVSERGGEQEIRFVTLTAETENAVIIAVFEESCFPEEVSLHVTALEEDDPEISQVREKLMREEENQGRTVTALLPFDITFLDSRGFETEPSGDVQIAVELKTPVNDKGEPADTTAEAGAVAGRAPDNTRAAAAAGTGDRTAAGSADADGARDEEGGDGEAPGEHVWELFHISPDGELENHSGRDTTAIDEDGENRLYGVIFQSDSFSTYILAARGRQAAEGPLTVRNLRELQSAFENYPAAVIVLDEDIFVDDDTEGVVTGKPLIRIWGSDKNYILYLNTHRILVDKDRVSFMDISDGASLIIRDVYQEDGGDSGSGGETGGLWGTDIVEELPPLLYEDGEAIDIEKSQVGVIWEETEGADRAYGTGAADRTETADRRAEADRAYEKEGAWTFYAAEITSANESTGETREKLVRYTAQKPGMITVRGDDAYSAFYVQNGTLTLESGAVAYCSNRAVNIPVGAKDSVLNLSGGYLYGNTAAPGDYGGGAVIARSYSGKINLTGTSVLNNRADIGGAFSLLYDTSLDMSGGYIAGNQAEGDGGAIYKNYGNSDGNGSGLVFEGGYVTNNRSGGKGGAVYCGYSGEDNVNKITLREGCHFTNNLAWNSGGAIYTYLHSRLAMEGGFVTRNLAVEQEGGGIAVQTGSAVFTKGWITGNRTDTHQHWGGGGIFISDHSQAYMENVLVTENRAGAFGGGVAGCPTSRVYISVTDGMAMYDNRGGAPGRVTEENGEDEDRKRLRQHLSRDGSTKRQDYIYAFGNEKFLQSGYDDFFCALTCKVDCQMLGGGLAGWGGSVDGLVVENPAEPLECAALMGLTAHPAAEARKKAQSRAKLFVSGNSSWTHAGGILCNGYLIAGTVEELNVPDRIALEGQKALVDAGGERISLTEGQFQFEIFNEKLVSLGTFGNRADGSIDFDLMLGASKGGNLVYYVKEAGGAAGEILPDTTVYKIKMEVTETGPIPMISPEDPGKILDKYVCAITDVTLLKRLDGRMEAPEEDGGWETVEGKVWKKNEAEQGYDILYLNGQNNISFTNRRIEKARVAVSKKWDTDGEPQILLPDKVRVGLLRNGEKYGSEQELSEANDWSCSWEELPVKDEETGKAFSYSVYEQPVRGFHSEVTVERDTGSEDCFRFTITNIPDDKVKYRAEIYKVSEANEHVKLGKAHFCLLDSKNQPLKFKDTTEGYVFPDGDGSGGDFTDDLVTDTLGTLILKDLPKGEYILRETIAPPGYVRAEDQKLTLGAENQADGTTVRLTIKDPLYSLPETGGEGNRRYLLGGLALAAGSIWYSAEKRKILKNRYKRGRKV